MPLNDKFIKATKPESKSRKYFDGGGMYLEVSPSGGKWWRLKYRINGVEKRISLGTYPEVSLKEARDKAFEHRKAVQEGLDPSVERRRINGKSRLLFLEVGQEWLMKEKSNWKEKHIANTISRLDRLIYPHIGKKPIDSLEPTDILALCNRIKDSVSVYSAHVIRSLCSRIFRYAVVCGYVSSDPCRDLVDALPAHKHKAMAALTKPNEISTLLKAIDCYQGNIKTCIALKLLPLLMVRTGELRHAEWEEVDFDDALWRIPGHKMKMGKDHIVPLSRQALDLLSQLKKATGHCKFLFPGRRSDSRVMSENTIIAALRYMDYSSDQMTGHGFRSMASTCLNEMSFRSDIIEKQLAHEEGNSVRRVYNRAEYLEERRNMMQVWADYLDSLKLGLAKTNG